jgi:hypothetical protein
MWVIAIVLAYIVAITGFVIWFAKGLIDTGIYGFALLMVIIILYGIYSVVGYWGLYSLGAIGFIWLSISAAQDQ